MEGERRSDPENLEKEEKKLLNTSDVASVLVLCLYELNEVSQPCDVLLFSFGKWDFKGQRSLRIYTGAHC